MEPQWVSAASDVMVAVVALLALRLAGKQLKRNHEDQKNATAKSIYMNYLRLAFDNPTYSSPSYPKDAAGYDTLKADADSYEKYEWFLSNLLFSTEEILQLEVGPDWKKMLTDQIKYHALYFKEANFQRDHYYPPVQMLIRRAIEEYDKE